MTERDRNGTAWRVERDGKGRDRKGTVQRDGTGPRGTGRWTAWKGMVSRQDGERRDGVGRWFLSVRDRWFLYIPSSPSPFLPSPSPFVLIPLRSIWSHSVPSGLSLCSIWSLSVPSYAGPYPFRLVSLCSNRFLFVPSRVSPFLLVLLRSTWPLSVSFGRPPSHLVPLRSILSPPFHLVPLRSI